MKQQGTKLIGSLGLMAMLAMATPALAGGPGMHDGHPGKAFKEELNLSDEQADKLKDLRESYRPRMQKVHEKLRENRKALFRLDPAKPGYLEEVRRLAAEQGKLVERMVFLRAEVRAKTAAILTPEQREKAHELFRERLEHRMGRHHHPDDHGPSPDEPME